MGLGSALASIIGLGLTEVGFLTGRDLGLVSGFGFG